MRRSLLFALLLTVPFGASAQTLYKYNDENGRWQRDGTSDLGRISRQQDFLRRTVNQLLAKGAWNPDVAGALIEHENFAEALYSLDDPEAIRGCGKPVILAIGHKKDLPQEMMKVAAQRNKLVFKDLRQALEAPAKEQALATWQSAMETCYSCHQGQDGREAFPLIHQLNPGSQVTGTGAVGFGRPARTGHHPCRW